MPARNLDKLIAQSAVVDAAPLPVDMVPWTRTKSNAVVLYAYEYGGNLTWWPANTEIPSDAHPLFFRAGVA